MRLYMRYLAIHIKSQMQYKASLLILFFGQFLFSFTMFLSIAFMMTRFHRVEDYSVSEVLLCFSVVNIAFALAECFARGFDTFSSMISNGEFDRVLVRPRGEILQVLGSKIELTRIGRLLQSALVLAYAVPASGIDWTGDKIFTLVLMILSGALVFSGLFVVYAAFCFFTTEALEIFNIFTDGGREFGRYPFGVYGKEVLRFFTYIVPLALFQYYPLLYLTGRSANRLHQLTPLLALVFLVPCLLFWRLGVRRYKSTGS